MTKAWTAGTSTSGLVRSGSRSRRRVGCCSGQVARFKPKRPRRQFLVGRNTWIKRTISFTLMLKTTKNYLCPIAGQDIPNAVSTIYTSKLGDEYIHDNTDINVTPMTYPGPEPETHRIVGASTAEVALQSNMSSAFVVMVNEMIKASEGADDDPRKDDRKPLLGIHRYIWSVTAYQHYELLREYRQRARTRRGFGLGEAGRYRGIGTELHKSHFASSRHGFGHVVLRAPNFLNLLCADFFFFFCASETRDLKNFELNLRQRSLDFKAENVRKRYLQQPGGHVVSSGCNVALTSHHCDPGSIPGEFTHAATRALAFHPGDPGSTPDRFTRAVARALASHPGEPGSIPGGFTRAVTKALATHHGDSGSIPGGFTRAVTRVLAFHPGDPSSIPGGFTRAVTRALATHHGDQGSIPGGFTRAVTRVLACHPGDPGSIPGGFTRVFPHVGIVLDDGVCPEVFSGYSCFPRPCIPAPLQDRNISDLFSLIRRTPVDSLGLEHGNPCALSLPNYAKGGVESQFAISVGVVRSAYLATRQGEARDHLPCERLQSCKEPRPPTALHFTRSCFKPHGTATRVRESRRAKCTPIVPAIKWPANKRHEEGAHNKSQLISPVAFRPIEAVARHEATRRVTPLQRVCYILLKQPSGSYLCTTNEYGEYCRNSEATEHLFALLELVSWTNTTQLPYGERDSQRLPNRQPLAHVRHVVYDTCKRHSSSAPFVNIRVRPCTGVPVLCSVCRVLPFAGLTARYIICVATADADGACDACNQKDRHNNGPEGCRTAGAVQHVFEASEPAQGLACWPRDISWPREGGGWEHSIFHWPVWAWYRPHTALRGPAHSAGDLSFAFQGAPSSQTLKPLRSGARVLVDTPSSLLPYRDVTFLGIRLHARVEACDGGPRGNLRTICTPRAQTLYWFPASSNTVKSFNTIRGLSAVCVRKYFEMFVHFVLPSSRDRDGVVVRLLTCLLGELGSVTSGVAIGFLHVRIVPDDDAVNWTHAKEKVKENRSAKPTGNVHNYDEPDRQTVCSSSTRGHQSDRLGSTARALLSDVTAMKYKCRPPSSFLLQAGLVWMAGGSCQLQSDALPGIHTSRSSKDEEWIVLDRCTTLSTRKPLSEILPEIGPAISVEIFSGRHRSTFIALMDFNCCGMEQVPVRGSLFDFLAETLLELWVHVSSANHPQPSSVSTLPLNQSRVVQTAVCSLYHYERAPVSRARCTRVLYVYRTIAVSTDRCCYFICNVKVLSHVRQLTKSELTFPPQVNVVHGKRRRFLTNAIEESCAERSWNIMKCAKESPLWKCRGEREKQYSLGPLVRGGALKGDSRRKPSVQGASLVALQTDGRCWN
ncbi:hypothetical protein PR048_021051 [Dryococelus australis]|uniref:Uncharacterized protein n=1 Tax=Dryococelus australis TaxID=614101 RepID=A0ABQ9GX89_9NEOP|nr:hypothetical protein PR048_021051 [Dryococelus australis]